MPLLPTGSGCELYCEAQSLGLSNGANVSSFTDQSGKGRHLTTGSNFPTFQTNVINGQSIIRWNGSTSTPLTNAANITGIKCGWMVAKYSGSTFAAYAGLLTGLATYNILVGDVSTTEFYDFGVSGPSKFEFRSNDRIYPVASAPGPMNAFKVIFFRNWDGYPLDGISLCQQVNLTSRRWNGDVALLALYTRDFTEEEIRTNSKAVAANFALTLADVYEYQADVTGHDETPVQAVNFYDPPTGDRVSEAVNFSKRVLDLKFSAAGQTEVKYMKAFHAAHYGTSLPFLYRDYRITPPEDIEGYFDSQYDLSGYSYDHNYSFSFKER